MFQTTNWRTALDPFLSQPPSSAILTPVYGYACGEFNLAVAVIDSAGQLELPVAAYKIAVAAGVDVVVIATVNTIEITSANTTTTISSLVLHAATHMCD